MSAATYSSPDEACRASRSGWAISASSVKMFNARFPKGVLLQIKYGDGSPYFVYQTSPGIRYSYGKPNSGDIESVRAWRPW